MHAAWSVSASTGLMAAMQTPDELCQRILAHRSSAVTCGCHWLLSRLCCAEKFLSQSPAALCSLCTCLNTRVPGHPCSMLCSMHSSIGCHIDVGLARVCLVSLKLLPLRCQLWLSLSCCLKSCKQGCCLESAHLGLTKWLFMPESDSISFRP